MGKIYEMVVNTDPTYMYLQRNNPIVDNLTVVAHALAHSDFFKNNICFKNTNRNMMNVMASHGQKIRSYMDLYGRQTVLDFLDACISVDDLIDPSLVWRKSKIKRPKKYDFDDKPKEENIARIETKEYLDKFVNPEAYIEKQRSDALFKEKRRSERFPEKPERDILLYILNYIPLKPWQQNILSMVRDEAIYFRPQGMTKVMNEGWASYWDSYIMTTCGFAGDDGIFDYAKHHAGVLGGKYNLSNPYKLGNTLFNDIKNRWDKGQFGKEYEECDDYYEKKNWDKKLGLGMEKIYDVRANYNDVTFINEFFTEEFCRKHEYFEYQKMPSTGEYVCVSKDYKSIKKKLIERYINCGRPVITLENLKHNDTEIYIKHQYDGRALEREYAVGTMKMLHRITKRTIRLATTAETITKTMGIPSRRTQDIDWVWDGSNLRQIPQTMKYN
jgi:stage V sporulation protein R